VVGWVSSCASRVGRGDFVGAGANAFEREGRSRLVKGKGASGGGAFAEGNEPWGCRRGVDCFDGRLEGDGVAEGRRYFWR